MFALFFLILSILSFSGCSHHVTRDGIMSQELPLTVDDLSEIRSGEENHEKVVLWQHQLYRNLQLENYLNAIASVIAEVSTRPSLPYKVFILDENDVNVFAGPGGYIYMTRGLLEYVQSESEIAGLIAHEIGHISHYDYSNLPQHAKVKRFYAGLLKGSELARDSIGSYGSAAYYGIKGIGQVAPHVMKRFNQDAEIQADEKAVQYLLAAGYDPRQFQNFLERLARVERNEIPRFVILMNTHPPFPDRRVVLENRLQAIHFDDGKIELRQDMLSEMRRANVNAPTSIIFEPESGTRHVDALEMDEFQQDKNEKLTPAVRKHWEWF